MAVPNKQHSVAALSTEDEATFDEFKHDIRLPETVKKWGHTSQPRPLNSAHRFVAVAHDIGRFTRSGLGKRLPYPETACINAEILMVAKLENVSQIA
jgi:hypothetical protein